MPVRMLGPKGVNLGAVPLEEGKSGNEDTGPKGVNCDVLHWLERRTTPIYKGVETSRLLKPTIKSRPFIIV